MEKLKQLRRSDDSVPAEWQVKKLEDFAVLQRGFDLPVQNRKEGPYPVYGSNGINGFHAQAAVKAPGVLTGRSGSIGFVFYVDEDFWPLNTTLYVKNFHDNYPPFVKLVLEALELDRFAAATGVPSLNRNFVHPLPVRVPPFDQQVEIAKVITQIDRVIELTETLIAKQQRLKTGLMQKLLTKGIDEQGKLRSEATHEFKDSPLGRIPVEWDVKTLADIVPPDRPIVYGILMPGTGWPGGIPVIKVKDIKNGAIDTSDLLLTSPQIDNQYSRSKTRVGDLLFTIRGTVGRTAFVPESLDGANITQDTARISISAGDPRFIQSYLGMPVSKKFIDIHTLGVAVQGINLGDVRRIRVGFPQIEEQCLIGNLLEKQETCIQDDMAYRDKLIKLKTGLMQTLLTGKVRVTSLLETQSRTDG